MGDALLDAVRAGADEAEATRRLTDEVVAGLRASGINRMFLPAELGGTERPVREVVERITQIGAIDGSTAWCAAIGMGTNLFAGWMPRSGAEAVFVDPDASGASMFGPYGTVTRSGAGMTMTGRWPFTSNCLHGSVIGLGAWVPDASGEMPRAPRLVFLPIDEVTVEDTWDAHGLRATGSHHTSVTDTTIELDRTLAFHEPTWPDGPLWRVPVFSALSPVLAAAPLGVAFGARDLLLEQLLGGQAGAVRSALADDPLGLAALAAVDCTLRAAEAGLLVVADELWDEVSAGNPPSRSLQARVVLASMHAVDVAVEATSMLHSLAGGAAAYAPNPLVRKLRDVETARQHILFSKQSRPGLMRLAAGFDEILPPYVYS